jgi:hypothetical protein
MVNAVVPHAELERTALDWARKVNGKSPTAQRMLKFAFNLIDDGLVGQQVFAGEATRLAYGTAEAAEGRDAFLGKRDPDWSGVPALLITRRQPRGTLWAAAHLADQQVPADAVPVPPLNDMPEVNLVGQFRHGLVGCLGETRPSQQVNYFLPAVLREDNLLADGRYARLLMRGYASAPARRRARVRAARLAARRRTRDVTCCRDRRAPSTREIPPTP